MQKYPYNKNVAKHYQTEINDKKVKGKNTFKILVTFVR